MYIYLAFYIGSDKVYSRSKQSINSTLQKYFGSMVELSSTESIKRVGDGRASETEVLVYALRKPIVKESDQMHQFFENLEQVFNILSGYSPHFTQESEHAVLAEEIS